ncbi:MAG: uracil-DNA glycosylase family protein [Candidatus Obscuribacterales bacterium]|nr:uracil-DNA glycosylase family protein [Candidatus Obscuribacterales bacterium]
MTPDTKTNKIAEITRHIELLLSCAKCPNMIGPVVTHRPVISKVLLIGQAPGPREGAMGKPFAWTAGKTLFRWLESIGLKEEEFRSRAYMSAVCRCFPGKTKTGGDRVPSPVEIENCSVWLDSEFEILDPDLVIPVGKLAIAQLMQFSQMTEVVGSSFKLKIHGRERDIIPLPHPSGASSWFKKEPGKSLLQDALQLISVHPEWRRLLKSPMEQ